MSGPHTLRTNTRQAGRGLCIEKEAPSSSDRVERAARRLGPKRPDPHRVIANAALEPTKLMSGQAKLMTSPVISSSEV